ncbi:HIT domain-containing protein [Cognaticolwellia mytili]|uniref:HIT domain-containing protein n=1 Tax=Cognaticolwellia mytili TaxID=1888913 RepID=UPI000A16EF9A|nr:HIT domain-containing protein [Cognaticolwellia mytili]
MADNNTPEETIFSKIIRQEIPAPLLFQDELVSAFRDITPQAKSHILIVPNKLIPTVNDIEEEDELTIGRMFTVARKLAKEEGIAEDGYRLIMNCNKHGGQEVYHIHMHLIGGQPLGRMLNPK